jgi:hypothetical protein
LSDSELAILERMKPDIYYLGQRNQSFLITASVQEDRLNSSSTSVAMARCIYLLDQLMTSSPVSPNHFYIQIRLVGEIDSTHSIGKGNSFGIVSLSRFEPANDSLARSSALNALASFESPENPSNNDSISAKFPLAWSEICVAYDGIQRAAKLDVNTALVIDVNWRPGQRAGERMETSFAIWLLAVKSHIIPSDRVLLHLEKESRLIITQSSPSQQFAGDPNLSKIFEESGLEWEKFEALRNRISLGSSLNKPSSRLWRLRPMTQPK